VSLTDLSVTRPVFAAVISLLLVAFGLVAFDRLPLREYPDIDPPVVTIDTEYPGAAASVIETRITELIEERLAGIEGIAFMQSSSQDGRSRITIEFNPGRDVDSAANDVRDRVSGIVDQLPDEADPPDIQKVDSNDDVIMWLNLVSDRMDMLELTDYADRYLVDRFSTLDGVARIRLSGFSYAMRIWLDRSAMAAHGLAVNDVEAALRAQNVELPAGSIESEERNFTARVERGFKTEEDFERLIIARGASGHLVRLGDVARIERGPVEERSFFRGNLIPQVSLGTVKQAKANTLEVAQRVKDEAERIRPTLPEGMELAQSFDTSIFIDEAIAEVYKTLFIAIGLVVLTILIFFGSFRATLVPAVTVPVSLIATSIVLLLMGFSINLLTLLALVLAIGLVVDDTIVVLENIQRRVERGETPLVGAYKGARQVGFAVIATTLVLISVFVPLAFLEGKIGRLFSEFALTMAAAIAFSSFVALSLSPMLASKVLKGDAGKKSGAAALVDRVFDGIRRAYKVTLRGALRLPAVTIVLFFAGLAASGYLLSLLPSEYSPKEDRGVFFVSINGPEGASFDYTRAYMDEIERRLYPLVEDGEVLRLLIRAPGGFGNLSEFNTGRAILVLTDFGDRRGGFEIMEDVKQRLADLPGVRTSPIMRQGLGGGVSKPVQFVLGGGTFEDLARWRDIMIAEIEANNSNLVNVDHDFKATKPELKVEINRDLAGDLGVTVSNLGRTLETLFGSRRVTTYIDGGEEYDVILEARRDAQVTPRDLSNLFIRSDKTGDLVPLTDLVTIEETAGPPSLNRYNRVRAITIEADLADGYTLGEALAWMEERADALLPESAQIDYRGQSRDFKTAGSSILFVFLLGIVVVFLVLSAQFESFVHPFVIMLTVPLAIGGGLFGIWLSGGTLNTYTQIGLIMLVGLAAKNGILVVEFINQLRDEGWSFMEAIEEASGIRLRPILMTAITTAAGAIPLILASGAGAETRAAIGVVIFWGVVAATIFTVYVVPVAYRLVASGTTSPKATQQRLEKEMGAPVSPPPGTPDPAPGE